MSKKPVLSNSAAMGIVSDADIRKQATMAFADKQQSDTLAGSAVQRLAYAVTAEHFTMNQGKAGLPALEATLATADKAASAAAAKTLFDKLVTYFLPEPATPEKGSSDKIEDAKATRTAREQLLKRAIQLAAVLAKAKVTLSAFDPATGQFTVPCKLLLMPGETPRGRIAANPTVALDGKPILLTRKATDGSDDDVDDKAQASVTRLTKVNAPTKPRKDKKREDVGLDKHASEVARILTVSTAPVAFRDLSDSLKNSLAAIVKWWDEQQEASRNTPAKTAAK
jgi:hypothetical protein